MRRPGPTGSATTVTSGSLPVFYRTSPVQSQSASASCGEISQPCAIVPCSTAAILGLFRLNAENPQRFVLTIPSRRLASALPRISRSLERARPRVCSPPNSSTTARSSFTIMSHIIATNGALVNSAVKVDKVGRCYPNSPVQKLGLGGPPGTISFQSRGNAAPESAAIHRRAAWNSLT